MWTARHVSEWSVVSQQREKSGEGGRQVFRKMLMLIKYGVLHWNQAIAFSMLAIPQETF
jgi:hypothetical protein